MLNYEQAWAEAQIDSHPSFLIEWLGPDCNTHKMYALAVDIQRSQPWREALDILNDLRYLRTSTEEREFASAA